MNRTRRIATTIVAASGILGAAGVAVAATDSSRDPTTPPAGADAGTSTGDHPGAADQDQRALAAYIASMSARGDLLDRKLGTAEAQLAHARAVHATRVGRARAAAAARAAAQVAAQAAAQAQARAAARPASRPTTHTSTGASGASGSGGDDGEHEGHDD